MVEANRLDREGPVSRSAEASTWLLWTRRRSPGLWISQRDSQRDSRLAQSLNNLGGALLSTAANTADGRAVVPSGARGVEGGPARSRRADVALTLNNLAAL